MLKTQGKSQLHSCAKIYTPQLKRFQESCQPVLRLVFTSDLRIQSRSRNAPINVKPLGGGGGRE